MVGQAPSVENPRHICLTTMKQTLTSAEVRAAIVNAFDKAIVALESGKVWNGPAARALHRELIERKQHLARLYGELVAAVDAELSRTPTRTTRPDARYQRHEQPYSS